MTPYFFLLVLPLLFLIPKGEGASRGISREFYTGLSFVILVLFIGLRYQVGADWFSYEAYLERAYTLPFDELLEGGDPGFQLINWFVASVEGEGWLVNLISGVIFTAGLLKFCSKMPDPKAALAASLAYLVMVVAMGYTRQAIAIGLVMYGIAYLYEKRVLSAIVMMLLATTLHKTAVILLPLIALSRTSGRWFTYPLMILLTFASYTAFLEESTETLIQNYLFAGYSSQGALVRILMSVLPAIIFLRYSKRFSIPADLAKFWKWCSWICILLLVAYSLSPSSTAVDRIALYFIPIQLFVYGSLPEVFSAGNPQVARHLRWGIYAYTALVMLVWLNFAAHAFAWLPYRVYPIFG